MADPFSPEVVAAIMAHMNGDHAADNLVIVRALGGVPEAEHARMSGMDATGIDFDVTVGAVGERQVPVRLAWSQPLTERSQVRPEVVRLYERAVALTGHSPGGSPGSG